MEMINLYRHCEDTHYKLLCGMYFDKEEKVHGATVVYSNNLSDLLWNYGTRVNLAAKIDEVIESVSRILTLRGRTPAFYLPSYNEIPDLLQSLVDTGFQAQFRDAWMFWDKNPPEAVDSKFRFSFVENPKDMDQFAGIYDDAYRGGDGPYAFPPEYTKAVRSSYKSHVAGVLARNYLAHDRDGEVVGILSLISKGRLYGVYNVATIPSKQGRGIGSSLILKSVHDAFKMGAKAIFLQTEPDSTNEAFYRNRGFSTKFLATCYSKS